MNYSDAVTIENPGEIWPVTSTRISLRDYFAGQGLAGLMGDPGMRPYNTSEYSHMAERLYQVADAMMIAREKGAPQPVNGVKIAGDALVVAIRAYFNDVTGEVGSYDVIQAAVADYEEAGKVAENSR